MQLISEYWKKFISSKLGLTLIALIPFALIILVVIWLYKKFIKNKK